ncbi:MAG: FAD-binding oxidoreductase [Acidobacteriota bacterium]
MRQVILNQLNEIVGSENIITEPEKMGDYSHDEFSLKEISRLPEVVVKPASTAEVSRVMELAVKEKFPVTPRGGATGLCGGCVPSKGGIVLSLERMNRVLEVDQINQMAVVEAGMRLSEFYKAIEETGLFFPPHPGEESAMIGGLIATNAGGSRAVKYGVIRNYVRGLKVVLAGGKILNLGGKLMKSSTGYNLLQLIIGSEGTLGVITKAIIQLQPVPPLTRSLIIPFADLEQAIETVPALSKNKIVPLAVEFISKDVIRITEDFLRKTWPSRKGQTDILIILDASTEAEIDHLSQRVAEICLEKRALDVYVADSPSKQREVLEIRSKMYEAIKNETIEILDIVVPRSEIAGHVKKVQQVSEKYGLWLPTFGHAADGNVHTHIMRCKFRDGACTPLSSDEWRPKIDKIRDELYRDCQNRGGHISGEHGIGLVKKSYFSLVADEEMVRLMKGIKKIFDPEGICNPGKIFD